jgi:ubiquinone/menaquinone biosynthesis C-methylase UbiE
MSEYVHGYSDIEASRLCDQARALQDLLHHDTSYAAGSLVLEAGCGVGAQTVTLLRNSPGARLICVDISPDSLVEARRRVSEAGLDGASFQRADILQLPFEPGSFDHVFVCFVLEHLADPKGALGYLKTMLKEGGTITVIEGDHGSAYFHPESEAARRDVECLVRLQRRSGGNALIGRELYPLLHAVGFKDVRVSPRMVYVDSSRPELVEYFTRRTFTAMVAGVREEAISSGMISEGDFDKGIEGLNRTAEEDGTFCYTFFKATAFK